MAVRTKTGFNKKAKGGGSGGSSRVLYVPKAGVVVRLLAGPHKWESFEEFWDGSSYVILTDENEDQVPEGRCPSVRYLAPAVDVKQNRVVAVKLPYTLAEEIVALEEKYEKKGWELTDYDIELQKEGEGTDTVYRALFDEKSDIDLDAYPLPDLHAIIDELTAPKATAEAEIEDDTDVSETPVRAKKLLKKG